MAFKDLNISEKAYLIKKLADGGYLNGIPAGKFISTVAHLYDTGGMKNQPDSETVDSKYYREQSENPMYDYLRQRGLNHAQASGLLGNLAVESYLNADLQQFRGGPGYGLIQAEDTRQRALKSHPSVYQFGSGLSQLEQQQLDYIIDKGIDSYTPGEWRYNGYKGAREARKAFLNTDNVDDASLIISRNYLRPGKPQQSRRDAMSRYIDEKMRTRYRYRPDMIEGFVWNPDKKAFGGHLFDEGGDAPTKRDIRRENRRLNRQYKRDNISYGEHSPNEGDVKTYFENLNAQDLTYNNPQFPNQEPDPQTWVGSWQYGKYLNDALPENSPEAYMAKDLKEDDSFIYPDLLDSSVVTAERRKDISPLVQHNLRQSYDFNQNWAHEMNTRQAPGFLKLTGAFLSPIGIDAAVSLAPGLFEAGKDALSLLNPYAYGEALRWGIPHYFGNSVGVMTAADVAGKLGTAAGLGLDAYFGYEGIKDLTGDKASKLASAASDMMNGSSFGEAISDNFSGGDALDIGFDALGILGLNNAAHVASDYTLKGLDYIKNTDIYKKVEPEIVNYFNRNDFKVKSNELRSSINDWTETKVFVDDYISSILHFEDPSAYRDALEAELKATKDPAIKAMLEDVLSIDATNLFIGAGTNKSMMEKSFKSIFDKFEVKNGLVTKTISYTDLNGKIHSSTINEYAGTGEIRVEANGNIKFNPIKKEFNSPTSIYEIGNLNSKTFAKNFTEVKPEVAEAMLQDAKELRSLLGEDATFAGSVSVYIDGDKLFISGYRPNDFELITTESRYKAVKKKLGNTYGWSPKKTDTVYSGNTASGKLIEVEVLEEGSIPGTSRGIIAEETYMYLYPEKYHALLKMHEGEEIVESIDIPKSTEELYQTFYNNPDIMRMKTLMDNTMSARAKHSERILSLIDQNPGVSSKLISKIGTAYFGREYLVDFEKATKNIDFSNVSANEQFLKKLGLPIIWATDETKMKDLYSVWRFQECSVTRGVKPDSGGGLSKEDFVSRLRQNFGHQSAAGGGGNNVANSKIGGGLNYSSGGAMGMNFIPLSYNEESFTTVMDGFNAWDRTRFEFKGPTSVADLFTEEQKEVLKTMQAITGQSFDINNITGSEVHSLIKQYNATLVNRTNFDDPDAVKLLEERIADISEKLDLTAVRGENYKEYNVKGDVIKGGYTGKLTKDGMYIGAPFRSKVVNKVKSRLEPGGVVADYKMKSDGFGTTNTLKGGYDFSNASDIEVLKTEYGESSIENVVATIREAEKAISKRFETLNDLIDRNAVDFKDYDEFVTALSESLSKTYRAAWINRNISALRDDAIKTSKNIKETVDNDLFNRKVLGVDIEQVFLDNDIVEAVKEYKKSYEAYITYKNTMAEMDNSIKDLDKEKDAVLALYHKYLGISSRIQDHLQLGAAIGGVGSVLMASLYGLNNENSKSNASAAYNNITADDDYSTYLSYLNEFNVDSYDELPNYAKKVLVEKDAFNKMHKEIYDIQSAIASKLGALTIYSNKINLDSLSKNASSILETLGVDSYSELSPIQKDALLELVTRAYAENNGIKVYNIKKDDRVEIQRLVESFKR